MLKLFQIRNLHGPPFTRGVIQISEADYDDIATNHPPARLTYVDDDDGDQITVGSSLELSQRLDEPIAVRRVLASGHLAHYESEFMHTFDINRSNSVTDLWKQFEYSPNAGPSIDEIKPELPQASEVESRDAAPDQAPASDDDASTSSASRAETHPLLAAFETELGRLLSSNEISETHTRQADPSPTAGPSVNHDPQNFPPAIAALVTQLVHYLRNGVNVVQSEVRTRMPELRRHLMEAQRELPEHLAVSLQALVAQLDAKMRDFAHVHLPEQGRQMAEDALNAGRPIAESAVGSLWALSSELEQAGRTLFAAFENEMRRNTPNGTSVPTSEASSAPTGVPDQASSGPGLQVSESVPVKGPSHTEGLAAPPSFTSQGPQPAPPSHEIPPNTLNTGQYTSAQTSVHSWSHPQDQGWPYMPPQHWPPFSPSTSQGTPLTGEVPWNTGWHTPPTSNLHTPGWPRSHQPYKPALPDWLGEKPQASCQAPDHHSVPVQPRVRQSLATDTWARLDGRERRRARQASSQAADITSNLNQTDQPPPTSQPKTNVDQAKETEIENCINSLANMGFGGPEHGGRSRLAVYAAAANGSVFDAIELIEEEQKYYATMD